MCDVTSAFAHRILYEGTGFKVTRFTLIEPTTLCTLRPSLRSIVMNSWEKNCWTLFFRWKCYISCDSIYSSQSTGKACVREQVSECSLIEALVGKAWVSELVRPCHITPNMGRQGRGMRRASEVTTPHEGRVAQGPPEPCAMCVFLS